MSTHSVAPVVAFTTSFHAQIQVMEGKLNSWKQDFDTNKVPADSLLKDECNQIYALVHKYLGQFANTVEAYKNFEVKVYSEQDLKKQISNWKVQPADTLIAKLENLVTLHTELLFAHQQKISQLKDKVEACILDELNGSDSDSDE